MTASSGIINFILKAEGYTFDTRKFTQTFSVRMVYNEDMKKYITSNPKIMSGAPVIVGTRVPIARIIYLLKDGYTIEQISDQFPHVGLKNLRSAINELAQKVETVPYGTQISQTQVTA